MEVDKLRLYVLRYGGRVAGRFSSVEAAQDELERLSRLSMKRGFLPSAFEINRCSGEPARERQ